jgi:hypothetical protein
MMFRNLRAYFNAAAFAALYAALATVAAPAAAQGRLAGLPDFTDLYDKQGRRSSIDVTQRARRSRMPELSEDDPFYEFFRRFGQIPRPRGAPEREFEQQSVGSGFIISSDGYLITNAHVVDGADEVLVKLTDKREFKAKVIGADKRTDIALLKIEAKDLPKVTIGDPEKLKVGEWVVAIGKPFGLDNTMTAGIVSAKGRDLPQENLVPFIRPTLRSIQEFWRAAVQPEGRGRFGINSLIFSRTGGYMGLSFAIDRPRDEHRRAVEGEGPRYARAHRCPDHRGDQGDRGVVRLAEGDGRARQFRRKGRTGGKGRAGSRRHHRQGRWPRSPQLVGVAAHRDDGQAGHEGNAHGLAQGRAARRRRDGCRDEGRSGRHAGAARGERPSPKERPNPTGWASSCRSHRGPEEGASTSRAGC